ncbi:hypothetical protein [Methanosarcina horonobensis]|uniref:hypothetical protein n=1 Tax=Methanosarcina horonobensis TaxID=418008 RepID=UPI000ABC7C92|nr:hypothetical protein [Methanosarcina horonobensis]
MGAGAKRTLDFFGNIKTKAGDWPSHKEKRPRDWPELYLSYSATVTIRVRAQRAGSLAAIASE